MLMQRFGSGLWKRRRGSGAASYISDWLLRDDFTTTEAAPIASPRTAEPGPGTWTVTDTGNKLSLSGGAMVWAGITSTFTNPAIATTIANLIVGRCYMSEWTIGDTAFNNDVIRALDFVSSQLRTTFGGSTVLILSGGNGPTAVFSIPDLSTRSFWAINTAAGILYFGYDTDYRLLYPPIHVMSTGFNITCANSQSVAHSLKRAYAVNLSAPWTTAYPIAINRVASPSTGETTTAEADALTEFTWTPAAGETLDLMVRRDSDTDCWSVVCAESTAANANTIKLIERNSGDTERSSVAQTFTAGVAYRIVVVAVGTTIRTYVDNRDKISYSSATNNQASTGVKASGFTTGSNLVVWPRTLSGAAKAALDEVANA